MPPKRTPCPYRGILRPTHPDTHYIHEHMFRLRTHPRQHRVIWAHPKCHQTSLAQAKVRTKRGQSPPLGGAVAGSGEAVSSCGDTQMVNKTQMGRRIITKPPDPQMGGWTYMYTDTYTQVEVTHTLKLPVRHRDTPQHTNPEMYTSRYRERHKDDMRSTQNCQLDYLDRSNQHRLSQINSPVSTPRPSPRPHQLSYSFTDGDQ